MTLRDQLDCARRELAMRRNVYPKWVSSGKMTPAKADHELRAMEAIAATLERVMELNEAGLAWIAEREGGPR